MKISVCLPTFLAVFISLGGVAASADQVTLRNGDILNGKVLSMTTNVLVLQDDSLGTLTLPRAKVSTMTLGQATLVPPTPAMSMTNSVQTNSRFAPHANSTSDLQSMFREIQQHSNLVEEVEAQVLGSSASPAAVNKFNDLLGQLSTGQLDMNGLRSQAQSAVDQLQEYKKEMGPNAGEEVDGYLYILKTFLSETAPSNGASH